MKDITTSLFQTLKYRVPLSLPTMKYLICRSPDAVQKIHRIIKKEKKRAL